MGAKCLLCGKPYAVRDSKALYAEGFCSQECEKDFVEHVGRYYGIDVSELRVLAIMPQGNA